VLVTWSSVSDKGGLVIQKEVALMESPARTGNAAGSSRVPNSAADKEPSKHPLHIQHQKWCIKFPVQRYASRFINVWYSCDPI